MEAHKDWLQELYAEYYKLQKWDVDPTKAEDMAIRKEWLKTRPPLLFMSR